MRYILYVPAPGAVHDIWPGSAILGDMKDDMIHTHYEGGGAVNVQTYEDKINQAAGRRSHNYPTSACRSWEVEDLIPVGEVVYHQGMRHWIVEKLLNESAMRAWIAPDDPVTPGGSDKLYIQEGGRRFGDLPAREQSRIIAMKLPQAALCAEIIRAYERLISETD